jgi:hypothetical protein
MRIRTHEYKGSITKYSSEKKAKGYSKPKITGHLGGW